MLYTEKYDCIYSASGAGGRDPNDLTEEFKVPLNHYACYSDIYKHIRYLPYSEVTYNIYLYDKDLPDKNYNLCTKLETKKILRCLQHTVPFNYKFSKAVYKISQSSKNKTNFKVLTIFIKGNYAQHLWITSMLRCFYEWPYNIAAKEACLLQSEVKNVDGFNVEKTNWINLYLTIASLLGSSSLHGVSSMQRQPKALTYKDWEYQLKNIKGSPILIDKIGKKSFKRDIQGIRILSEKEYKKGINSRASKYIAAYKDKLSWKK